MACNPPIPVNGTKRFQKRPCTGYIGRLRHINPRNIPDTFSPCGNIQHSSGEIRLKNFRNTYRRHILFCPQMPQPVAGTGSDPSCTPGTLLRHVKAYSYSLQPGHAAARVENLFTAKARINDNPHALYSKRCLSNWSRKDYFAFPRCRRSDSKPLLFKRKHSV